MQPYLTLTRRELGAYFLSLTGYIIIAAVTFLLGLSFVVLLVKLQQEPTPIPVTELFYITQFFWLILLLSTPVITMRLFAQEKASGTFETLMTAPVSELQVVLSKFTAGLIFYALAWLPLMACLLIVRHFSNEPDAFDAGVVASTFLGILLLGAMFVSLGCCASALTRSQVAAAMITLVSSGTIFCLGVLADRFPNQTNWHAQLLASLAFFDQMHDFARGVVDTRSIVLYVSLTLFFLFLTLRIVESRRWK
ncbi:MAG TPA: ABC transporter permease [Verrucomicrobiae bacterium]|nr:ABC transporter permease [Verrucomicrobiae bacterium]